MKESAVSQDEAYKGMKDGGQKCPWERVEAGQCPDPRPGTLREGKVLRGWEV